MASPCLPARHTFGQLADLGRLSDAWLCTDHGPLGPGARVWRAAWGPPAEAPTRPLRRCPGLSDTAAALARAQPEAAGWLLPRMHARTRRESAPSVLGDTDEEDTEEGGAGEVHAGEGVGDGHQTLSYPTSAKILARTAGTRWTLRRTLRRTRTENSLALLVPPLLSGLVDCALRRFPVHQAVELGGDGCRRRGGWRSLFLGAPQADGVRRLLTSRDQSFSVRVPPRQPRDV
ncbi:unnamed protein product [Prorocentrum cordatum]|uniref:Uncharacterized protein n=1 Tax=Prorocentrum cordatum TaxID=2364126 RepID=A0ABN9WLS7_9DINO|nr:unnamed protein product [Polarella glacialis]